MTKKKGGFHVVRIAHNDKFFSYEIWFENQPYLLPSISLIGYGSAVLGKREKLIQLFVL